MCIYYRESLAVELVEANYLSERLLCNSSINNKKGYVAVLYRTPSQISLELDDFILCFEMMLSDINSSNPQFSIILGDFKRDHYLTTSYGFQQLISELTHILKNSCSSIDLIFTDQPVLITDSGAHTSLHRNCDHNIIFVR